MSYPLLVAVSNLLQTSLNVLARFPTKSSAFSAFGMRFVASILNFSEFDSVSGVLMP